MTKPPDHYGHPVLWAARYKKEFVNTLVQASPEPVPWAGTFIDAHVVTDPRTYGRYYNDPRLKEWQ